jgi:hypothetical protein
MVSIMPGMEARAPERTDSSSGSLALPNCLPISVSRNFTPAKYFALNQREDSLATLLSESGASLGADGEARRHGNAQPTHLGQVGPLATEQVLHGGGAFGARAAKEVNEF